MAKRKAEYKTSETEKPTKKPTKSKNHASISICIPSTVISNKNAYNLEQKTFIVYQIAKACLIYNVSEIIVINVPEDRKSEEKEEIKEEVKIGNKVVFNENISNNESKSKSEQDDDDAQGDGLLLASLLQFFITPPYLIKTMFSSTLNKKFKFILNKFKYAFKLPKITTLPFMSNNSVFKDFKEGIIIPRETPKIKNKKGIKIKSPHKIKVSKYVNIGESKPLKLNIEREIPIYSRVTVDLKNQTIINPEKAYGLTGYKSSFGYYVRLINSNQFNKVFTGSPIESGYSKTIFVNCDDYFNKVDNSGILENLKSIEEDTDLKKDENVLLILGNYNTIQDSFNKDDEKSTIFSGIDSVLQLFDFKLNIPQGCKIEDSIMISLTKLLNG
ncbi:uncharacterized protein KGF55_001034 [Candida pseudojiufengensis]|uniref:uncharacterized protein n=1 Tax=Candida pseudojiufengensis TaxID=497109 RepID=UPI002224F134|nr:uncharacterized protein KGF55_001034 [Candida pseudojiufengensis]KAI5965672.1 hypothetical protein KGF55_001034 [Candida pseudojiufengensis]